MPKPGDRIAGKYRIERPLGAGGMGCVLAAEHVILRTRVAIKILLPQAAAVPGAAERFLREAKAAAALRSEHVARVSDVGSTEAGVPFLVMEHLTGQDLRKIVRERGALPAGEAVEYLLQTCDAVLEAHARGIIHRDLKPSNIFVTTRPDGSPLVKVLDFGLAKVLDPAGKDVPEESITHSGLVVGSPHYMSPEQFRSLRKADARSDIWALGVIAYEILAGRRPFLGEGMSGVMMSVVTDEPEPLGGIRPDLPAPLVALVMKCLEKTPDRRPQRVSEIVSALKSLGLPKPEWPTVPSTARIQSDDPAGSGSGSVESAPSIRTAYESLPSDSDAPGSGTGKAVSVGPDDASDDAAATRQVPRDRRGRSWWLVAGAVALVGVAAVIGLRAFDTAPRPSAAGDTATAKEPAVAPTSVQVAPAATPEPTPAAPAISGSAGPSGTPASSAPPPADTATAEPKKTAKPPAPKATSKAGSPDPFGKYD